MLHTFHQTNTLVPDTRRALLCHGGADVFQVGHGTRQTGVPPEGAARPEMTLRVVDRLHFVFIVGVRGEKGG